MSGPERRPLLTPAVGIGWFYYLTKPDLALLAKGPCVGRFADTGAQPFRWTAASPKTSHLPKRRPAVSDAEYVFLLKRLDRLRDESVVACAETRRLIEESRAAVKAFHETDARMLSAPEVEPC